MADPRFTKAYTDAQKTAILRASAEEWTALQIVEMAELGLLGVPAFKINPAYIYTIIRKGRARAEAEGRELPGPGPAKNVLESLLSLVGRANTPLDGDARALLRLIEAGRKDLMAGRPAKRVRGVGRGSG